MTNTPECRSCHGTGGTPTDYGVVDCPHCGGSGELPSRSVLVDWRARDVERAAERGRAMEPEDALFLVAELRKARAALTDVIALAHDVHDGDAIANKIRFTANRALGLYEIVEEEPEQH